MLTNAELAILSLIIEQPRHGYEIEQVIEARQMRNWTEIGFSSIYYVLKKLERDGLIESRLEAASGPGPARRVYSATPAGETAWREAALAALTGPPRATSPLLIGMANLPMLPPGEAVSALRRYLAGLGKRREHILEQIEKQSPLPAHAAAMFDYRSEMIGAEQRWIESFIHHLEGNQHGS